MGPFGLSGIQALPTHTYALGGGGGGEDSTLINTSVSVKEVPFRIISHETS